MKLEQLPVEAVVISNKTHERWEKDNDDYWGEVSFHCVDCREQLTKEEAEERFGDDFKIISLPVSFLADLEGVSTEVWLEAHEKSGWTYL